MKKKIIAIFLLTASIFAGTSDFSGTVTKIMFYGNQYSPATTNVKFQLDNMGAQAPGVNWFVIQSDEEFRNEMVSMLLTAKTTGIKVRVRYHSTVNDSEERVHVLSFD